MEKDLDELEQIEIIGFKKLEDFMTAYEKKDFNTAIKKGNALLNSSMLSDSQKEEINNMISQAKQAVHNSKEDNIFLGL